MRLLSNSDVSELIRLVPTLLDLIPPDQSTRVQNGIRITRNIIRKLEKRYGKEIEEKEEG